MQKLAFLSSLLATGVLATGVLATGALAATPAASRDASRLCPGKEPFPPQSAFHVPFPAQPRAATVADGLVPKVEQVRNGVVIATYRDLRSDPATCRADLADNNNPAIAAATGCGPFSNIAHTDLFRLWKNGDTFRVYPAVYDGNLLIGPRGDKATGWTNTFVPDGLTIQGITVNGIRPVLRLTHPGGVWSDAQGVVYVWNSSNTTIDNIDIDGSGLPTTYHPMGAVYVNGAHSLTLSHMRITDFDHSGANGVFGTSNNTGTLSFSDMEVARSGGPYGPKHHFYIGSSSTDPNFTVKVRRLWSHDAYYGHLFKSRAQITDIQDSWFIGGVAQPGFTQAETYEIDTPNGGSVTLKNNVIAKNYSGNNSNGALFTFGVEGIASDEAPTRVHKLDVEGNTFVAFSQFYDNQKHPIWPMFFYNHAVPGTPAYVVPVKGGGTVVPSVTVSGNTFVGFCAPAWSGYAWMNYRGDNATIAGFADLKPDYTLRTAR